MTMGGYWSDFREMLVFARMVIIEPWSELGVDTESGCI